MPAPIPVPAPTPQNDAPTPNDGQKTILVVDDDPAILQFVSTLLVPGNYNVLTAPTGQDALRQASAYKGEIDLLLSDFQMPGMSGIELATKIAAKRPLLKVLMMSGFTDGMLVLNEGWHFLAKPFVASQLRALVQGLVFPENNSRFSKP